MPDWWEHGGNMDPDLHHVSDREHWVVNSPVNLTSVTLYWKNNAHALGEICIHSLCAGDESDYDPADLSLTYYDGMWVDLGGTAQGNHNEGYISSGPIPFSSKGTKVVTFGSKNDIDPLPVELVSFSSICHNETVLLEWQTASEINSAYFVIEKSLNAIDFEEIGRIPAAGNSNELLYYNFTDLRNEHTAKYYRLKTVDIDGSFEYSNNLVAYCYEVSNPVVMVYPNPFRDILYIKGENMNGEQSQVLIYDMLGKLLYAEKLDNSYGSFGTEIHLGHLCPAMYAVKVVCSDFTQTIKIDKH